MSSCSNPIGYPKIKQKTTSVLERKGEDLGTQPFSCSQASRFGRELAIAGRVY